MKQALEEHNVSYGTFISGGGELKSFDLISDNYDKPVFSGPFLLDRVSGNVKLQKQGHTINLHVTLLKKGAKAYPMTGQLRKAVVNGNLQLTIQLSDLGKIIQ